MAERLNILLLSRYFPPEIGTAANLFFEMARGLVIRGHKVTVLTNFPWYNLDTVPEKYRWKFFMRENIEGVEVLRLKLPLPGTRNIKLAAGHLTVPITTFLSGLFVKKIDVMFLYSPPLFMGIAGWLLHLIKRKPIVFGVQDLHPQCYIDQGILKNKLAIKLLERLEKFCYDKAAAVTVHSDGNKSHIVDLKGIAAQKVRVIPNWIDTDEMKPLPRDNEFAQKHNLNGKFVVGYAGTLGMSQGLLSVIDAARILRDRKDIEFFIVGDGIEKRTMIDRVKEYSLENVKFLEMQPKAVYPFVVASCDVGLVTLNSKVKTPVVPSKILSLMAAAKPVLASMPLDGDAPKLIEEAGCGVCIPPESPELMAEKILYLAANPKQCEMFSRQGREYVVEEMSLKKAVSRLERLFEEVIDIKN